MLTINIEASNELVNGARGKVESVIHTTSEINLVLVKIHHSRVGAPVELCMKWKD